MRNCNANKKKQGFISQVFAHIQFHNVNETNINLGTNFRAHMRNYYLNGVAGLVKISQFS